MDESQELTRLTNELTEAFLKMKEFKETWPSMKGGYYTNVPGSILNAYRESDLSFGEAIDAINALKKTGGMPCGICGGSQVEIRGRYPQDQRRLVCPTCLAERMDDINNISARHYLLAAQVPPTAPALAGEGIDK